MRAIAPENSSAVIVFCGANEVERGYSATESLSLSGSEGSAFRLIFQSLREDGVNLNPASRLVLDSWPRGRMVAVGNGYFRVEVRLPIATRPGVYRLVGALSSAAVAADYTGEAPKATVSPVGESYCMTVVAGARAQATPLP